MQQTYANLYKLAPIGLLTFDREDRILDINVAAGELLKMSPDRAMGTLFSRFVHPDDREVFFHYKQNLFTNGLRQLCELNFTSEPGAVFPARLIGIAVQEGSGEDTVCITSIEEISEQKEVEKSLRKFIAALERKNIRATEQCHHEKDKRELLSKRLIDLLEQERQQLACDLHDDIGQHLASIKIIAEDLLDRRSVNRDIGAELSIIRDRTIQLMSRIRNFSHWLRPSTLDKIGLKSSLDQLSREIENRCRHLKIHFHSANFREELDMEKKIACFRIAQEALTNIIKHAQAEEVHLNLSQHQKSLFLSIEDDGIGFELDKATGGDHQKEHLGLLIMEERAAQLKGEFIVDTQPGRGTHILVKFPL